MDKDYKQDISQSSTGRWRWTRRWSDESLAKRAWGGDRALEVIGSAVDAVLWLVSVAFLLIRGLEWLGHEVPFVDPAALEVVKSAVWIPGFKDVVRRVLIVALAFPLILAGWLVRWVRRARRRCS
ncbi:UNVERIFIED_ORG: hypothetical protein M2328_006434 [Rhodococcus erythropolis]